MEPSKSQVGVIADLIEHLLRCDPLCTASKALNRDVVTLRHRTSFEGLSFLTKTLPKLGKALDQGLASMQFILPHEFKPSFGNKNIPAFMQAYFNCIFDANGTLLDNADPVAVRHCRQVCFVAYKLEIPSSKKQIQISLNEFVALDETLSLDLDKDASEILEVASFIVEKIFKDFDPKDIIPRHGPGAVATGEKLEEKWEFSRLYDNIHQTYPYYEYFVVGGGRELEDRKEWYMRLARLETGQAKVIAVPKDSRGPRLISCEPLEYQWIQQGLGRKIVSHLESFWMTKGQINFTDQNINRKLALLSSSFTFERRNPSSKVEGDLTFPGNYVPQKTISSWPEPYATIDMKDASDRVSLALVRELFKRVPRLLRALEACRTSSTVLPDGRIVEFRKFAPMGSALCFPVEAVCFWSLLVAASSRHYRLRQSVVGRNVFVYGDDIIIPCELAHYGIQSLEKFALKVNLSKCCIHGPFRESCGLDAFKGEEVTPLRVKTPWTGRKSDGSAYVSWVSFANQIALRGYKGCSDFVWALLESTYGTIPFGTSLSSYPCKIVSDPDVAESENSKLFRRRTSRRYQRFEYLLSVTTTRRIKSRIEGWPRMMRNIVSPPYGDPSTIVVPRSMIIKRGWTPVF